MELDKRITNGRKPFDCVDAGISETVKSFIGKKGYFANHISEFTDISDLEEDVLTFINPDEPDCEVYTASCETWEYFLPSEWVKEPEKKWRPYTGIEFAEKFNLKLNSIIHLRSVPTYDHDCYYYKVVFTGYRWYDDVFQVFLNGYWLDLPELLELYEYREDGEWHKFGVEE